LVVREAVRRHVEDPRLRGRWAVFVVVFGLTFVPLFGTLGYESSLVLSPLFALLGILVATRDLDEERQREEITSVARLGRLALSGTRELGILLGLALVVMVAGGLWRESCDTAGGLLFFLIGPACSAALGWVAGLCGASLARRRWKQLALGLLPSVACVVVALRRLYADPVVFAYDPFWGYFSGSIYDENVPIQATYLWFRGYNALAAGAALLAWTALVDPATLRWRRALAGGRAARVRLVIAGAAFVGALVVGLQPARVGFTATTETVTRVLTLQRTTEHFVIHYAPRSSTMREIDWLAAEHEFAWNRLERTLATAPETPIHSFVFSSARQKRALMGAGRAQIAAPWRSHVYLNAGPGLSGGLHHELAHVFGAAFGDPILGVSPKLGLVEGLATAMAPVSRYRLDLHDQAAAMDRLGKRPPLSAMMGLGFWTSASSHAYTTAGSFCLWLIETRGVEAFKRLYGSFATFDEVYGQSLAELEESWVSFVRARLIRAEDVDALAQRFRRRSVFERPCAHRIARLREESRLANERGRPEEGIEPIQTLCELEPERPEHRLQLANQLARGRLFAAAHDALDEARALGDLTVSVDAQISERRGDMALFLGDLAMAERAYDAALVLPLDEARVRGLQLKRVAARDRKLAPLIADYYAHFDNEGTSLVRAVARIHVAHLVRDTTGYGALGSYLVGRQLLNVQRFEQAIEPFERSLVGSSSGRALPSPEFVRAARVALLSSYARTGRYERARSMIESLRSDPELGSGGRQQLDLWRERIDFLSSYVEPASG
jgi:tetratricopeptide (TPR) repeat protein